MAAYISTSGGWCMDCLSLFMRECMLSVHIQSCALKEPNYARHCSAYYFFDEMAAENLAWGKDAEFVNESWWLASAVI